MSLVAVLSLAAALARPPSCGPEDWLVQGAILGLLGSDDVACLEARVQHESPVQAEHTWRLLLVDARARGKHRRWRRLLRERAEWRVLVLMEIHGGGPAGVDLLSLDGFDPDVHLAKVYACHVVSKARDFAARVSPGPPVFDCGDPDTYPTREGACDALLRQRGGGDVSG